MGFQEQSEKVQQKKLVEFASVSELLFIFAFFFSSVRRKADLPQHVHFHP
jgi:hypothetical protein